MTEQHDDFYCAPGDNCLKPLLRRGFGIFWENKVLLIGTQAILFAIVLCGDYLLRGVGGNVLLGPFLLGMYKINLALARNQEATFGDILAGFENFLPAFIVNILVHLAFLLGVSLLLIPGLLVLLTYSLSYLFLLEKNLGIWDAMESSRKMVWRNKKWWITFGAMLLAINVAGLLCFVVGLAATVPYSSLLITLAYEEEQARSRQESMALPMDIVAESP